MVDQHRGRRSHDRIDKLYRQGVASDHRVDNGDHVDHSPRRCLAFRESSADRSEVGIAEPPLHLRIAVKVVGKSVASEKFLHVEDKDAGGNNHSYQQSPGRKLQKKRTLLWMLVDEIADDG